MSENLPPPSDETPLFDLEAEMHNEMPGMKEALAELYDERIGRAIVFVRKPKESTQHLVAQSTSKPIEEMDIEHVGHILPLNREETRHIVVFPDGSMLIVQPESPSQNSTSNYQSHFKSSPDDMQYFERHRYTQDKIQSDFMRNMSFKSAKTTLINDTAEWAKQIDALIQESAKVAREIKAENIQARMQNATTFVRLYGRPKPPAEPPSPDAPTPPELPSTPQPPST